MTVRFMIMIAALIAAGSGTAQISASDHAVIEAYRTAVRSAEAGLTAGGVEAAFSALASLRQALTRERGNQRTVLESISNEEFERLKHELPGVLLNREEVLIVNPDPDYFAKLASAHGDAADRSFFSAFKATYPDAVWPAYLEQQTDYSGCTRFGSGKLVETYRVWMDYQGRFPSRYIVAARKEINDVSVQLTTSTCACGNVASVADELQRFLETFPASPIRARVNERLQAVRARRSDIRTPCVSG